jgi:beta-lactamase regulating signal transducer with metallopeptidase domain
MAEESAAALVWFHPAVGWRSGRIQLAREPALDRKAVRPTGARREYLEAEYLEALLAPATERSGLDLAPATLFLQSRPLARRVGADQRDRHPQGKARAGSGL